MTISISRSSSLLAMVSLVVPSILAQSTLAQVITNNVGLQTFGSGANVQITASGMVQTIDESAIVGAGSGIALSNAGSVELNYQNSFTGPADGGIHLLGANSSIDNTGNITAQLHNTVIGNNAGALSTTAIIGDNPFLRNSGLIETFIDAVPTIANTVDCPAPATNSINCVGTAVIGTVSQATDTISSVLLRGNSAILENTASGVIASHISRAIAGPSEAVHMDANNGVISNSGTILLDIDESAQELYYTGFLPPSDWQIVSGVEFSGGIFQLTPNGLSQAAIRVSGNNNSIINDGIIRSDDKRLFSTSSAIDAYLSGATGTTIVNNGDILHNSNGIIVNTGTIINNGNIYDPLSGSANGYLIFDTTNGLNNAFNGHIMMNNTSLVNNGTIGSFNHAPITSGVTISDPLNLATTGAPTDQIINRGTIMGFNNGIEANLSYELTNSGLIEGLRNGIVERNNLPLSEILNSGEIVGGVTGARVSSDTDIANSGSIHGENFGIQSINGSTNNSVFQLFNTGDIFGETAILVEEATFELDNAGSIYSTDGPGGYAIHLHPAVLGGFTLVPPTDDNIIFRAGTRIIGRMDLGSDSLLAFPPDSPNGNDTITLDRTSPDIAWRWTFDNFDIPGQDPIDQTGFGDSLFILGNNVPYYIWNGPQSGDYGPFPSDDGVTVYIPNISGLFATNGILEDIARTIHGGIRNRLNEGWDYENLPEHLFYREEEDIVLRDGSELAGVPLETLDPAVFRKAPPLTVWAKGFGGIRNETGTASHGDYSHVWSGGMAGLDLKVSQGDQQDDGLRDREDDDHWNIGLLGGYVLSDLTFDTSLKEIQSDFFFAGAYGRLVRDAYFLDASVIGGFGGMSEAGPIANNLVPGGIEYPGEGYSTNGRFISPSASVGKRFYITDSITFTPEFNATYLAQWIDGHSNPTAFSLEDRFADTVFGHIQGSIKKTIKQENTTIIGELRGGMFMSRQLRGDEVEIAVIDSSFTVDTSRDDIVSPYAGIGLTWEIGNSFKVSADAEMDFGDLKGSRLRFGGSLGF